jgi:hypothetical protein
MENITSPLTVFIHVPKTAGSTVNDYLLRSGRNGHAHVEAWINDDNTASSHLKTADWVSGHVPFGHMRARLSKNTNRHLRFFTLVRDPIKQLMSHYNWLIEIYHRSAAFYDGHPDQIKTISKNIREADNSDPLAVIAQLEATPGLFLNQQSRLVLGGLPIGKSDKEFKERLAVYEMIATEKHLPDFITKISGLPYDDTKRENVSQYHFDKNVFASKVMQDFINQKHSVDVALYEYLSGKPAS